MILPLVLLLAPSANPAARPDPLPPVAAHAPGMPDATIERYRRCTTLIQTDAQRAATEAEEWRRGGGGLAAGQCLGLAYARLERWAPAAIAFEQAAAEAQLRGDGRAAQLWVLAGNAALAGDDAARARDDLGKAITLPVLSDTQRGEAYLDRARAQVALANLPSARQDLDQALHLVAADPLGWLLSANLARRMNDMARARTDIGQALRLASDDASVQLEAGNIAAVGGVTDAARVAWRRAAELEPNGPAGQAAAQALAADRQGQAPAAAAPAAATPPPH